MSLFFTSLRFASFGVLIHMPSSDAQQPGCWSARNWDLCCCWECFRHRELAPSKCRLPRKSQWRIVKVCKFVEGNTQNIPKPYKQLRTRQRQGGKISTLWKHFNDHSVCLVCGLRGRTWWSAINICLEDWKSWDMDKCKAGYDQNNQKN